MRFILVVFTKRRNEINIYKVKHRNVDWNVRKKINKTTTTQQNKAEQKMNIRKNVKEKHNNFFSTLPNQRHSSNNQ